MKSLYSLLECDEACSSEELKCAYFDKLRKVHPDRSGLPNSDDFRTIQRAWEILGCATSRRDYNAWLDEQRLRAAKECVWCEVSLEPGNGDVGEFDCRCGGLFEIRPEDIDRVVDSALLECSNCSLCLKVAKSEESSR